MLLMYIGAGIFVIILKMAVAHDYRAGKSRHGNA